MEAAADCYAMADQCERQAAEISSVRVRQILLKLAVSWRDLGDALKARETILGDRSSRPANLH